MLKQAIYRLDDARRLLARKRAYLVAGSSEALKELPPGHWIGGTVSSVMSGRGPLVNGELVQVTTLPSYINRLVMKSYDSETISSIYDDCPEHGLTFLIVPAGSEVAARFALTAANSERQALYPLAGWLAAEGDKGGEVFFGTKVRGSAARAVAMHLELPPNMYAELNYINLFQAGEGPVIEFMAEGFSCREALVDGRETNLAAFLSENGFNPAYPLVADYCGSLINVGLAGIDREKGEVTFNSPVLPGVRYSPGHLAGNYSELLREGLARVDRERTIFACNSIFSTLTAGSAEGELIKEESEKLKGPLTAGEIAYHLLNQTYTYVSIIESR